MVRFILKSNRIGTIAIAVLICFLCSDLAFATSRAGSDTDAAVALPSSPSTPTGSPIEGQRTFGIRISATSDGPPSGTRSPPGDRATSSEDSKPPNTVNMVVEAAGGYLWQLLVRLQWSLG